MNNESQNKIIEDYIIDKASRIIGIASDDIEKLRNQFIDSEKPIDKIKEEIDIQMDYLSNKYLDLFLKDNVFNDDQESNEVKEEKYQLFDYHTHTKRCCHAGNFNEEEYINEAIKHGLTRLGFSDHIAFYPLKLSNLQVRMPYTHMDEYIKKIYSLKEKHSDINIYCGFEAEFDPKIVSYLCDVRDSVDYMILGQHFVENVDSNDNPNYPIEYANIVVKAIETGIFDIVGHPDVYMLKRETIISDEDLKIFDENALIANKMIISKAIEYNIPLELNLAAIYREIIINNGTFAYPNADFWNLAIEKNARVIIARDSHNPDMFEKTSDIIKKVKEFIDYDSLYFVDDNYNPKTNRENNEMLNKSYAVTKGLKETYESLLAKEILSKELSDLDDDISFEQIIIKLIEIHNKYKNEYLEESKTRISRIVKQKQEIKNREDLSEEEKRRLSKLLTDEVSDINNCLVLKNEYLNMFYSAIEEIKTYGYLKKEQVINDIKDYIELDYLEDEEKKEILAIRLESKKEKAISNTLKISPDEINDEKEPIKEEKIDNDKTSNQGRINILGLVLLIETLLTFGVTLAILALNFLA